MQIFNLPPGYQLPACIGILSKIKYFHMKSFENSMTELRDIIDKLQSGNLPLEESIKLFQEGTKLIAYSHKKLDEIQKKVKILIEEKDGEIITEDFDTEE